jgi:four helix bundle protein
MPQNNYILKDFKNLIVWQKARELSKDIYKVCGKFPKFETYAARQQMIRAVTSIGANIAEGNGQLYKKRQISFFNNALGSASEIRHWLVTALDNGYISSEEYEKLEQQTVEIIKMTYGCIKKLREQTENDNEVA